MLLECNDVMFERINSNLDVLAGIRKHSEPIVVETEINTTPVAQKPVGSSGSWNEKRNSIISPINKTAK